MARTHFAQSVSLALVIFLVSTIIVLLYFINRLELEEAACKEKSSRWMTPPCQIPKKPMVLLIPKEVFQQLYALYLAWEVFLSIGYKVFPLGQNEYDKERCDIVWTHEYQYQNDDVQDIFFRSPINTKINHFTGIAYVANKKALSGMNGGSRYLPKTFHVPMQKEEFLNYAKEVGMDRLWVEKKTQHRNITLKEIEELDLKNHDNIDGGQIIQEFLRNQFLLHGHVMSLGVPVVITSVSPLRVYILGNGWMVRIADKPFHPLNVSDSETFISNAASKSLYDFKPMKDYFEIEYSRKQALHAYMVQSGYNKSRIDHIESQMSDAIQDVVYNRRERLTMLSKLQMQRLRSVGSSRTSFFDVMRWDFILDDDLRLYLLEANLSPNLGSKNTHQSILAKNRNLIYSTIHMLGYHHGSWSKNGMRDSDVTLVNVAVCYTSDCDDCLKKKCQLCSQCLENDMREMLKVSYTEHIHRLGFRRSHLIMTQNEAKTYNTSNDEGLSDKERINRAWFRAKCMEDQYWCQ